MQAVVFHEHGGPQVLRVEDMPQPTPGPGEVLLRVRAIAVNRTLDCEVRARPGAFGPIPMPHILGTGPAGEVAELGEGMHECQPGDRVVSFNGLWCGACRLCVAGQTNACVRMRIQGVHTQGGYAQFALAPARNLIRLPAKLSYEEATAMIVMAPTAWHLLIDRAQLRPGETVLILAAGGALGTAGIQVAKASRGTGDCRRRSGLEAPEGARPGRRRGDQLPHHEDERGSQAADGRPGGGRRLREPVCTGAVDGEPGQCGHAGAGGHLWGTGRRFRRDQ